MSVYANLFTVIVQGPVTRIVFEDAIEGRNGRPQSEVVMTTENAEELAAVLAKTIRSAGAREGGEGGK